MSHVQCDWRASGRCTRDGEVGLPTRGQRIRWLCTLHFEALHNAATRHGRSTIEQALEAGVFKRQAAAAAGGRR